MVVEAPRELVVAAVKYIVAAAVGALIAKRVQGEPNLVSNWGHASSFRLLEAGKVIVLHTHEVVVRNTGKKPAHNVRITHWVLPQYFSIWPSVPFTVEDLPQGGKDIIIPTLTAKEQITVSYLYEPPLTITQINAGIRCDESIATPVEMEISEKTPRWALVTAWVFALIGFGTVLFWVWRGLSRL